MCWMVRCLEDLCGWKAPWCFWRFFKYKIPPKNILNHPGGSGNLCPCVAEIWQFDTAVKSKSKGHLWNRVMISFIHNTARKKASYLGDHEKQRVVEGIVPGFGLRRIWSGDLQQTSRSSLSTLCSQRRVFSAATNGWDPVESDSAELRELRLDLNLCALKIDIPWFNCQKLLMYKLYLYIYII